MQVKLLAYEDALSIVTGPPRAGSTGKESPMSFGCPDERSVCAKTPLGQLDSRVDVAVKEGVLGGVGVLLGVMEEETVTVADRVEVGVAVREGVTDCVAAVDGVWEVVGVLVTVVVRAGVPESVAALVGVSVAVRVLEAAADAEPVGVLDAGVDVAEGGLVADDDRLREGDTEGVGKL